MVLSNRFGTTKVDLRRYSRMPRDRPTILAPILDRIAQRYLKEPFIVHR